MDLFYEHTKCRIIKFQIKPKYPQFIIPGDSQPLWQSRDFRGNYSQKIIRAVKFR